MSHSHTDQSRFLNCGINYQSFFVNLHKNLSKLLICFQTLGTARDIQYTAVNSITRYSLTHPPKSALPYIKFITVEKARNHFLKHLYHLQYLVKETNCWAKVTVPKLSQLPKTTHGINNDIINPSVLFQYSGEQNEKICQIPINPENVTFSESKKTQKNPPKPQTNKQKTPHKTSVKVIT